MRLKFTAVLFFAFFLLASGAGTLAQLSPTNSLADIESSKNSAESSDIVHQTLERKLAQARAEAQDDALLTNVPAGISVQDVAARRALLQRLVRLFEQQLSNAAELAVARKRRAELNKEAQAWTRFAEPPPYSILFTDGLREQMQAEELKIAASDAAVSTIEQLIIESRVALTQADGKIRQLNERLESAKDPAMVARLSWQRELERLRSQAAAASAAMLDTERQLHQETSAESHIRIALLRRQLVLADADVQFTQANLDTVMARIETDSQQLERELAEMQTRATSAFQALEDAREEFRQVETRTDSSPSAKALAAERVATRETQLETAQVATRTLRFMLESENVERAMWEMRFAAFGSRSVETLKESERRLESFLRRSALWNDYQQQQIDAAPSQVELQETQLRNLPPGSALIALARERLASLRERDQFLLRLVRRVEQVQRLSQRWAESLRLAEGQLPFFGRVQSLFFGAGSLLQKLWTFELFTAEDTITVEGQTITGKRSVTFGKVLMAVIILAVGIWLTRLLSRFVRPFIIRRFKMELNQAKLILSWFQAFMVVCLLMFSMVSVKIPLTVFAFAGGALAIGLGFGMQTILKNIVSGLILLFERPFRIGDVLEVAGQRGIVTEIGLRASVLLLWDGIETLIPNSSLLENNVSNWTYSSRKVRFSITVGVAYGSDTRRVIQLLTEMADRHGVIEKEPKPQVLFTDFGDSALMFELRFWVDVIRANSAQVGSDLRQMIAGAFAESGIVLAFPQRDIHLDAARPLPVEVVAPLQKTLLDADASAPLAQPVNKSN